MAQVTVHLWGSLQALANDRESVEVEAANIRQMLNEIKVLYPALKDFIDAGVSVAVDGQIHRDDLLMPVEATQEIYLFPRMAGG